MARQAQAIQGFRVLGVEVTVIRRVGRDRVECASAWFVDFYSVETVFRMAEDAAAALQKFFSIQEK